MAEKAYRFSASAIDEMNRHSGTPPARMKDFALLMVGLAGLVLLFYAMILL
jgi:hypothetical protein